MPVLKYKNPADGMYVPLAPVEEVTISASPPPIPTDLWVDVQDNSGGVQDSGWRNLASLLLNGWTPRAGTLGVGVRRIGNFVSLSVSGLDPPGTSATVVMTKLPGFMPTPYIYPHVPLVGQSTWTVITTISLYVGQSMTDFLTISGSAAPAKGTFMSAFVTYPTDDPWPATLPGVAW